MKSQPRTVLWLIFACVPMMLGAQTVEQREGETLEGPKRKADAQGESPGLSKTSALIIEQTNEFRKKQGLEPVEKNTALTKAARYFADYMARTDEYGHQADDKTPAQRAKNHGYDYCIVLENIAWQYRSTGFAARELAEEFFQGWKNSPEHRKNMLHPAVTETGVAVARSSDTGKYYAVQMFGRPESQAIDFKVTNRAGSEIRYRIGEKTYPLPPRYTRTHHRCQPADLTFLPPADTKTKDDEAGRTVQPERGDHFTVTSIKDGKIELRKERFEP